MVGDGVGGARPVWISTDWGSGAVETAGMDDLEEWTPLHELAAFFGAASPHEFHRMLVTLPPVPGNTGDTFLPWCLFHKFHEGQPDGAATTAMLLVTDRRWRTATGRLIGRIAESGLVPAEDLDLLAQTFLAAGRCVYWEVPAEWFDGPEIVIEGADTEPDEPDEVSAAEASDRTSGRDARSGHRCAGGRPNGWSGPIRGSGVPWSPGRETRLEEWSRRLAWCPRRDRRAAGTGAKADPRSVRRLASA